MSKDTYTMLETSTLTGISKPSLRNYTRTYARHLSPGATPAAGEARVFSRDDLRVLRFAYSLTEQGSTHETVLQRIAAGELDAYDWYPPDDADGSSEPTQLLPPDQIRLLASMMEEYRQRDASAVARERELLDRIERLQSELGETRGRLAERGRWHPPAWWKYFFGSRDG